MSRNKKAREELERRYGKECFIEKLHLRIDKEPRKYTSKGQMERMKQLTYHHIKMRKDGGESSAENGALLSAENHAWFHKQSPQMQSYMNDIFQEYKRQKSKECKVVFVDSIETPFEIKPITFSIDERGRYNRAKEKRETRKLEKEYWEEEER